MILRNITWLRKDPITIFTLIVWFTFYIAWTIHWTNTTAAVLAVLKATRSKWFCKVEIKKNCVVFHSEKVQQHFFIFTLWIVWSAGSWTFLTCSPLWATFLILLTIKLPIRERIFKTGFATILWIRCSFATFYLKSRIYDKYQVNITNVKQ